MGAESLWKITEPSAQFYRKPKTALKKTGMQNEVQAHATAGVKIGNTLSKRNYTQKSCIIQFHLHEGREQAML